MLPAYDVNKTTAFTLEGDTSEPKTVFHLGVIDAKAEAYLNTKFRTIEMRGTGAKNEKGEAVLEPVISIDRDNKDLETVALGVKGAENFGATLTFNEKTYPFGRRRVLTEESLNLIKPYIEELAEAIRNENTFTADEAKK